MKHLDLLLMRFVLLNIAGLVVLWYGVDNGVVQATFLLDDTYVSSAILGVFFLTMVYAACFLFRCSQGINAAIQDRESPFPLRSERYQIYTEANVNTLTRLMNIMLLLGLAGTMYGLIRAVSDVDVTTLGDVSTVGVELSKMISGIHVVFVTTLTGILTALWTGIHLTMLENGYRRLYLVRGGHRVST